MSGDELLELPDNECDLLVYLTQLSQLVGGDGDIALIANGVPSGSRSNPVRPTPPPGRIQGTVLREGTSEPIAGVMISADSYKTITDSAGRFVFDNILPGTRAITAQLEGYFGRSHCGAFTTTTRIEVAVTSQQTADVKIGLIPGGAISGKVFDAAGVPQSDTLVQVYLFAYQEGSRYLQQVNGKTSDDRGDYRIYRLPPGDYYVAGIPRSQPGNPGIHASSDIPVKTFYGNAPDPARSTPIAIKGGEEVTGVNISIQPEHGVTVSGQIFSELPALVQITDAAGQTRELSNAISTLTISPHDKNSLTDFNGRINVSMLAPNLGKFEIRNVPPGVYDLLAGLSDATGFGTQNPPGKAMGPMGFGRATVEARENDVAGIAITVHRGVDLKGRITVDGSSQAAQNVRISLQSADSASKNGVYQQVSRFQPNVDVNGNFTIPSVPEGRYRFQASYAGGAIASGQPTGPLPAGLQDAFIDDIRQGSDSVYDNGINVSAQSSGDVEVMIRTGTGSIQGTVVGVDRKPAASTMVVLVPSIDHRQNIALYKSVLSDSRGKFIINGIAPGNYELFSWEKFIGGAFQNADYIRKYDGLGTIVTALPGAGVTTEVHTIPSETR